MSTSEVTTIPASLIPPLEEIVNAITHGLGVILSIVALAILLVHVSFNAPDTSQVTAITGFSIFGLSLIILYSASAIYHAVCYTTWKEQMKILDHCAIYLLIAGSYTAFSLTLLPNWIGWTLFGINWGLAFFGIFIYAVLKKHTQWISMTLYLTMGWLIIVAIKPLLLYTDSTVIRFLVYGGVSYTIGSLFYLQKNWSWAHPIWHLFVLAGSTFHIIAAYCIY